LLDFFTCAQVPTICAPCLPVVWGPFATIMRTGFVPTTLSDDLHLHVGSQKAKRNADLEGLWFLLPPNPDLLHHRRFDRSCGCRRWASCWGIQENTSPSKRRSLMAFSEYVFQEQGIRESRKSETCKVSSSRMCRVRESWFGEKAGS
jgi:hypothetical protein